MGTLVAVITELVHVFTPRGFSHLHAQWCPHSHKFPVSWHDFKKRQSRPFDLLRFPDILKACWPQLRCSSQAAITMVASMWEFLTQVDIIMVVNAMPFLRQRYIKISCKVNKLLLCIHGSMASRHAHISVYFDMHHKGSLKNELRHTARTEYSWPYLNNA